MSFRKQKIAGSNVILALTPATESHSKVVDYSSNRIRALGGVAKLDMVHYNGQRCVAVIDTETTCETGDNFGKPLIYDVGVTFVLAETGEPVAKADFIISDVFCNAKLMKGAFFTNRVFTDYPYILSEGIANLVTFEEMLQDLGNLFEYFNVDTFAAYNSGFDTKAFVKTSDYIIRTTDESATIGLVDLLQTDKIKVLDLWAFSCMTFMSHDAYKEQAFEKHWFTKNFDKFSTNAESANNFINGSEVGEDHTALSDTAIEAGIYQFCLQQPEAQEVLKLCLSGKGETWGYVNNQGSASVRNWVLKNHADKIEEYDRLANS